MARHPDDILKDSVEAQQSLADAADTFKKFNDQFKITGKEVDNIKSLSTQLNNLMKESLILQGRIGKEYIKISEIQKDIVHLAAQELHTQKQIDSSYNKHYLNNKRIKQDVLDTLDAQKKIVEKEERLAYLYQNHATRKVAIKKLQNEILNLQIKEEAFMKKAGVNSIVNLEKQKQQAEKVRLNLEESVAIQEEFNKQAQITEEKLGSLAAIMKGIARIPIIGNLINTEKILTAMRDKLKASGSTWKAFGAGIKATFSEIGRIITDPLLMGIALLGIVKKLVQGVFEFDKNITDTANSLAISKEASQVLYKNFENITIHSTKLNENLNNSLLSISNQGKALNELNTQFGTSMMYTEQQIQDQIFLTKQMGMTTDEAKLIMQYGVLTNKTANDTLKTIIKQNDSVISFRKVISQVAKISGQLLAQYKNSPEALAKAVIQADKLGISLEQAKKQSEFLMNFQGSIEAELEAELVTGKRMNLERARALALMGDSASAAKEMLAQVGSFSEYSRLNVIQQGSLAKAVGMTADELTNALREQETLNKLGGINKDALQERYNLLKASNDQQG